MHDWLTSGNQADEARRLNTCLGFWTYQNYINLLYTKQSYTVVEKSISYDEREQAWIEPARDLYLHLENQIQQLMTHYNNQRLERFLSLLQKCGEISEKELQHIELDENDVAFLNTLDLELLSLTGGTDKPIVADVHTESNSGLVLEEAIGFPQIMTLEGENKGYRGALFTYYEFKHPMEDRLTDQAWLEILSDGKKLNELNLSPGSNLLNR